MPSQGGGTTVTLSNTSSQEHYEFDDNLPHVFQTPYELESASSHYTEPRVQSATLPSQYEIPVSALSTLQSSQVYVCVCAAVPNLVCQYAIKFCPQVTVKRFVTLLVGETT